MRKSVVFLLLLFSFVAKFQASSISNGGHSRIVFVRGYSAVGSGPFDQRSSICEINSDGTGFRDLNVSGYDPTFSPDGSKIAFVFADSGKNPEIYVMNADGSHVIQVSHTKLIASYPSWSPDGQSIVFEGREDWGKYPNVFMTRIDGQEAKQLTTAGGAQPAWSRSGGMIAFSSKTSTGSEISIIKPDGTDSHQLTNLKGLVMSSGWSPDDKEVAFGFDDGKQWRILAAGIDGLKVRELLSHKKFSFYNPSWSPDGDELAVTAQNHYENPWAKGPILTSILGRRIFVVSLKEGTVRQLRDEPSDHASFSRAH